MKPYRLGDIVRLRIPKQNFVTDKLPTFDEVYSPPSDDCIDITLATEENVIKANREEWDGLVKVRH